VFVTRSLVILSSLSSLWYRSCIVLCRHIVGACDSSKVLEALGGGCGALLLYCMRVLASRARCVKSCIACRRPTK
jgi:hypothetical protein